MVAREKNKEIFFGSGLALSLVYRGGLRDSKENIKTMKYELPTLPYAYDALEPYIDARTMEIHYTKHHQAYVTKLNEALDKHPELADKSLGELLRKLDALPPDIRTAVKNHGGGHMNHSFFWTMMGSPSEAWRRRVRVGKSSDAVICDVHGDFGRIFKETFCEDCGRRFGSAAGHGL